LAWSTKRTTASLLIKNGQVGDITNDEPRNFGAFLLTPTAAKLSTSFQVTYLPWAWPWSPERSRLGLSGYLQGGGAKWIVNEDGTLVDSRDVVAVAAGVGLATHVGPKTCTGILNCWGVTGVLSLATRGLLGDGGQDKAFRALALGTDAAPWWFGPELGARISVNDVSIGMSLAIFFASHKIPGLTGGQLIPMIDVAVPINVALTKPASETKEGEPKKSKAEEEREAEQGKIETRPVFAAPP
jgi:hypothetical protein